MPPTGERLSPEELKALQRGSMLERLGRTASLFTSRSSRYSKQKCVNCHHPGAGKASGLDLTSREKLLEGGDHGPVVVLDNPESSVLVGACVTPATAPECPSISRSCRLNRSPRSSTGSGQGAPYDAPIEVAKTQVKSDHWAFQKPVRAPLPKLTGPLASWSKNPVDILLAAKWQEKGLQPSPEADRRTLLRRVYIDVTGLPPTPEQIERFP